MSEAEIWPIIHQVAISSGVILLVFFVVWVLNVVMLKRLVNAAEKSRWNWDEALLKSLRKILPLFSLFLGLYLSMSFWDLSTELKATIAKYIIAALILLTTGFLISFSTHLFRLYGRAVINSNSTTSLTKNIVNGIVFVSGGLVLLSHFSIPIAPMLTALGVGGVAIALGLQETLTNVFAGIYISWAGQFGLGDYIKIDTGDEGRVDDIAWRETRIRTMFDNLIIIPNSQLAKAVVTNFDRPVKEMGFAFEMGIDYRSDLEHVERIAIEVAETVLRTTEGGVPNFKPRIRFRAFADSSINFAVIMRAQDYISHLLLKHTYIKKLHQRFREEGINIPYPIRTIVYQDKNLAQKVEGEQKERATGVFPEER